MPAQHDGVVFVVSDSPDIVEQVEKALADEPVELIFSSSPALAASEFDNFTAEVLLLACSSMTRTEALLTQLRQNSRRLKQSPTRLLALCNKSEVQRAYELCRKRQLDNYIVFWPLSFDHTRLSMSIYQALSELAEQHNSQQQADELNDKTQKLKKLKDVLKKQLSAGEDHNCRLEKLVGQTEQEVSAAISESYQNLMQQLATAQEAKSAPDIQKFKQDFAQVTRALQELRVLSSDFEQISSQHRAMASKLVRMSKKQRSVLVVEDDKFQRNVIRSMLAKENYQASFACNADEAFEQVKNSIPDLILMDVMIPGVNGIEVTRQFKQNPVLAHVPVVMITSHTNRDIVMDCRQAGATDFIVKPYNRDTLTSKVATMLKQHRLKS